MPYHGHFDHEGGLRVIYRGRKKQFSSNSLYQSKVSFHGLFSLDCMSRQKKRFLMLSGPQKK
jgi:metal-dependent hydrolase (beta-lactamase superfamily II)